MEEIQEKAKTFFKEHSKNIPEEFKKIIDDESIYKKENTWVLMLLALLIGNNFGKDNDKNV